MGKGYTLSSAERLSFGRGDHPFFDLLVEVVSERGLGLLAEGVALLLRAEPLLRALARTGDRLLCSGDCPLHGHRNAQQVNLSSALAKEKFRRDPSLLRFRKDAQRISRR